MTQIALISDVHANVTALKAVQVYIGAECPQAIVACLGDIVGYGSAPGEAIELTMSLAETELIIGGNHDYGLVGHEGFDTDAFNSLAKAAIEKHREWLSVEEKNWLAELPMFAEHDDILLCHGSPLSTNHYIVDEFDIRECLIHPRVLQNRIVCFGHTHVPLMSTIGGRAITIRYPFEESSDAPVTVDISSHDLVFINPGSVGQPRDGDPRACFAIIDTELNTISWHRVEYDVKQERKNIRKRGLPVQLGDRLLRGH